MGIRQLFEKAQELGDKDKCVLAAQVLSEADPKRENLEAFWLSLDETVRAELVARIEEFEK